MLEQVILICFVDRLSTTLLSIFFGSIFTVYLYWRYKTARTLDLVPVSKEVLVAAVGIAYRMRELVRFLHYHCANASKNNSLSCMDLKPGLPRISLSSPLKKQSIDSALVRCYAVPPI